MQMTSPAQTSLGVACPLHCCAGRREEQCLLGSVSAGIASALALHHSLPCQVPKPPLCCLVAQSAKPSQPWKVLH